MNFYVVKLNDRDAEGANLSGYVDLGPDMRDAGAVGTNDDCGDLNYSTGFLYPIGGPRSLGDHV